MTIDSDNINFATIMLLILIIIGVCINLDSVNNKLEKYNKILEEQNETILKLVESYDK